MTFWSWIVWLNRSMHTARCLGCRVLGLTLLTAGSHNTLRPVHKQACNGYCALARVCGRFSRAGPPVRLGGGENQWSCFWGIGPPFVQSWVCFLFGHTQLDIGRKRCYSGRRPSRSGGAPPLSRGPAHWGRGTSVADCRGVTVFLGNAVSIILPWISFCRGEQTMLLFYKNMDSYCMCLNCWIF